MKLSNADAVGGGGSSCVLEQQQRNGMSRRICKLLQWGKERYKLVLVVIKHRNKKKSVHIENLDVAKLTRSCARRRQPSMTRIGSINMKNPIHGFLTKLRDAYVNMMNTAASSGYFDDAGMAMCLDPWEFSAAACDKNSSDQCAGDLAIVALNLLALEITSSTSSSSNIATNLEVNGAAPKLPDLGSKLTNSSNQPLRTIDVSAGSGSFVKRSVHVRRTSSLLHTSITE